MNTIAGTTSRLFDELFLGLCLYTSADIAFDVDSLVQTLRSLQPTRLVR